MHKYYKILADNKFGESFHPTVDSITNELDQLKLDRKDIDKIKYHNFIELLKSGKFTKISFMTGAGISTTAGIPDFRSSTGLFKQMQDKYNLSTPEEFFAIITFIQHPEYFYEFCKDFDVSKYNPTPTHVKIIHKYI